MSVNPTESLPKEMWGNILSFLPPKVIVNFSRVNKLFHNFIFLVNNNLIPGENYKNFLAKYVAANIYVNKIAKRYSYIEYYKKEVLAFLINELKKKEIKIIWHIQSDAIFENEWSNYINKLNKDAANLWASLF